jgi:hypothetical protein
MRMPVRHLPCLAKLTVLTLSFLACAKGPPSGGPGSYRGVATGAEEIGILEVEVTESEKGPLPATGTLKFPSKTISLTGIIDQSKTELVLTSSDGYKIVGLSRPTYAFGSYTDATGDDTGSFALFLQNAGSSVELFCGSGSFDITADATTTRVTLPLAVTATPGGQAYCVGPNFVLSGGLGTDKTLKCASSAGELMEGKVDSQTNAWAGAGPTGTWAVTPCASNGRGGDAGVPEDAGAGDTASAK